MKRKIFSVLFALMLVLSFSLVMAVPVGANTDGVVLEIWDDGTAEWSTTPSGFAGNYCAKLTAPSGGIPGAPSVWTKSAAKIPYGETLSTLAGIGTENIIWRLYYPTGSAVPFGLLYLDTDLDGEADVLMHAQTKTVAHGGPTPDGWRDGEMYPDKWSPVGYDEGTITTPVEVDGTSWGFQTGPENKLTLSEWAAKGPVWADAVVLYVGSGYCASSNPAYVDDIIIDGTPYEFEWTHVSPIQVDDDRVQYPNAPFQTIQAAIDEAQAGDIVNVNDGTYEESISVTTANLTLRSENGRDSTTIENVGNVTSPEGAQCGFLIRGSAINFTLGGAADQGFTLVGDTANRIIQLNSAPSDVEISYNTINSTGVATHGLSVGPGVATRLTVSNNNFIADLSAPGGSEASFWGTDLVDVTVTWNVFTGTWVGVENTKYTPAIYFEGVTATSSLVPSTISNNEMTNHGRGILLETGESGTSDLLISNNDISSCFVGIKFDDVGAPAITTVTVTENTLTTNDIGLLITTGDNIDSTELTINYNEISGNTTYGLENLAGEPVTAKYNYWGAALNGPTHTSNTNGTGDAVSDAVTYAPWLYYTTADDGGDTVANIVDNEVPAYAQSVDLVAGWNTFSVPIGLYEQYNNWDQLISLTGLNYDIAWRFDVATQQFEGLATNSTYAIAPGEGFYIKMNSADSIPYCYDIEFSIPTRDLKAGWNMIGGSLTVDTEKATCISIATAGGTAGYSHIISPAENTNSWVYIAGVLRRSKGDFLAGEGYWVFLIQDRTLGLFDLTPQEWMP